MQKMIEIYLKYDNMHTFRVINAFICINNHVNSFINSMLSVSQVVVQPHGGATTLADNSNFCQNILKNHKKS